MQRRGMTSAHPGTVGIRHSRAVAESVIVALLLVATPARAGELDDLLAAARTENLDLREQAALIDEAEAEARATRGALWPALDVGASYTRNPYEVTLDLGSLGGMDDTTLVAENQVLATATLSIPLFDLGVWRRLDAAHAETEARKIVAEARTTDIERQVVVEWYRFVAGTALVAAAELGERTASDTLAVVEGRKAAGFASDVDVARARADVARAGHRRADAALIVTSARRELRNLTGREPAAAAPDLPDDVAAEAPLEAWLEDVEELPEVRAADAALRAGRYATNAQRAAWLPTIRAFARGTVTNAPGLLGEEQTFAAGVVASWRLDMVTIRTVSVARTRVHTGAVRAARATQQARERIIDAWEQVEVRRAAAASAAAEAEAAREGLAAAQTRIAAGLATPLDLTTAQRDAFSAEVSLVQARAELAAARALLRLAAGQPLSE